MGKVIQFDPLKRKAEKNKEEQVQIWFDGRWLTLADFFKEVKHEVDSARYS